MFLYAGTRGKGVLFSGLAGTLAAAPLSGWRVQMGKYYAHRASPAPGGKIPPKLYGGTERVVSWLTEELVALGHEVSLFATADAITKATLVPVWPSATRLSRPQPDPFAPMASLLEAVAAAAPRFDVIHCHLD